MQSYVNVIIKLPVEVFNDMLAFAVAKGFSGKGKAPLENLYSHAGQQYRNSRALTASEQGIYQSQLKAISSD